MKSSDPPSVSELGFERGEISASRSKTRISLRLYSA